MPTICHFIDVGQGNMTLLQLSDGTSILYDCNVTDENASRVLRYLRDVLTQPRINIFANSHRDADHMRGVKRIHAVFPIGTIWDSGVTGGTPDGPEYREYMELRRQLRESSVVEARKRWDFGRTRVRVMNAKNDALPDDPNSQSIVMKVQQHGEANGEELSSVMLTGDSDAQAWRRGILTVYDASDVRSSILLASHHGSITFFDDPADEKHYFVEHIKQIAPAMTIVSVGSNPHGHPDPKAMQLYEKYSSGSAQGNKVFRTDQKGSMRLMLKAEGGWSLAQV